MIVRVLTKIKRYLHKKPIILAYHRVFTPKADPQLLCVSPKNFEEQLQILIKYYNPISLAELSHAIKKQSLPNKAIVITFDDGYIDNLLFAKPLLEKYKIPATIFVTTHYINKKKELWWDELERITLPIEHTWDVTQNFFPSAKYKTYAELHQKLQPLSFQAREEALAALRKKYNLKDHPRKFYRVMTSDELREIAQSPYIEIGSHGITHSRFSSQNKKELLYEIRGSKTFLENITQKLVTSFSYPFGTHADIGTQTPTIVAQSGYSSATANFPAPVTKRTNRFLLPRYLVRNWSGKHLKQKLNQWHNNG